MNARRVSYLISTGSSMLDAPDSLGVIIGPRVRGIRPIKEGRSFAIDNDAFHGRFDERVFLDHLQRLEPYRERCLFVAAPDVVGDASATLALFEICRPRLHALGWPVAWVAQNGATEIPDNADAVFVGGDTVWKLGEAATHICRQARDRGLHVHIGRVNSRKRSVIAAHMGAHTVDGTHLAFKGRERGMREVSEWMEAAQIAAEQPRFI